MAVPTQDELKQLLSESTGVSASTITLDTPFEDLGIDSADAANFASKVQQKYGVPIEASDLAQMKTVGDFYRLIVSRSR